MGDSVTEPGGGGAGGAGVPAPEASIEPGRDESGVEKAERISPLMPWLLVCEKPGSIPGAGGGGGGGGGGMAAASSMAL